MDINFKGYGENAATFYADNSVAEGSLVCLSEDCTVRAAENGDEILGVCLSVRDGYAVVQLSGFAEVETSSKLSLGSVQLAAASDNKAAVSDEGRFYTVIFADNEKAGIIL